MAQEALPFEEMDEERRKAVTTDRIRRVRAWPAATTSMRFFTHVGEQMEMVRAALEDTIVDARGGPHEEEGADAALRGRTRERLRPIAVATGLLMRQLEAACRYGADAAAAIWLPPERDMELDEDEERRLQEYMVRAGAKDSRQIKRK